MLEGRCNCGAITFAVSHPPEGPSVCHCGQCRKQSGHVWASAYVPDGALLIDGPVKWYASSATAKRGFCSDCGSFLFWKGTGETTTSFALGALEGPTGLQIQKHIFTRDKGDYYEISDGLPQRE